MLQKGKTHVMSRDQIAKLPTPEGTPTWKPVPHRELIETLTGVLVEKRMEIVGEQYGVGRGGDRMFGILNLKTEMAGGDGQAALGFRQSNDRNMSIQICAGLSVFVCDNLVFRGDLIALRRKHTIGLNLRIEIEEAVEIFATHLGTLNNEVDRLKDEAISDERAKAVIHDAFVAKAMPVKYFKAVGQNYFQPPHDEFKPRTMWSLHNAFTEAAKAMPIPTRFRATQEIGRHFGMTGGV